MGCGSSVPDVSAGSRYPRQIYDNRNGLYSDDARDAVPPVVNPDLPETESSGVDDATRSPDPEDETEPEVVDQSELESQSRDRDEPVANIEAPPEADMPSDRRPDVGRWRQRTATQSELPLQLDDVRRFDYVVVDESRGYSRMGRNTVTLDTRDGREDPGRSRPQVEPGCLWEDPEFGDDVAFAGIEEKVFFMRPKELCDKPALFTDGTTRFDIEQGNVGTCYVLSVIASLADKQDIIDQIFVSRNYDPDSENYDGVLHVRFWRFGKWIDVYIDDRLPVHSHNGEIRIWAAKSHDPNELWVTLLEKAYTKEFGASYKKIFGGLTSEAFIHLTGGVSERFAHATDLENGKISDFFTRITRALKNGSLITCSSKGEKDGVNGLIGNHAYTVTGSGLVDLGGTEVQLLRIRNPWGSGEWTGAWSDESEEWKQVADDVKQALSVRGKDDGEFWISMGDYLDNYEDTVISNLTPDFDGDGKEDDLNQVCCVIGEWRGESAAGSGERKFDNPKFEIVVPDQVETTQVVLQCLQDESNQDSHHYSRVDLYSKDAVLSNGYTVYDELTNYLTYTDASQLSYRYNLKPGHYLILPTTLDQGKEGQFLLRTFSAVSLSCSQLTEVPKHVVRLSDLQFESADKVYSTPSLEYIPGAWHDTNAGGQIANDTFDRNPQYLIQVSGPSPVPLTILLIQEESNELPLGFKLWKREGQSLPLDLQQIHSCYGSALSTTEDEQVFVIASEAEGTFLVEPGEYILLVFTDEPDTYKDFVLCLATAENCQITHEDYNQ